MAVFINEINYDTEGTDVNERIEIAATAGTDLTGWSVVLYNGSNGTSYRTDALSGIVADLGSGFGTFIINYPSNGIQNGAPDGIALVNAAGKVVQFLSYEGTMTATNGPAAGLTSIDIGVSQSGGAADQPNNTCNSPVAAPNIPTSLGQQRRRRPLAQPIMARASAAVPPRPQARFPSAM